jgi:hypothetical protein
LLEGYVASVPHDDYITMASEGIIAIPLEGQASGGVLATGIHFYEFIPAAQAGDKAPDVLLAHELEEQHEYVVVLSTSGGLYRYNIGDVVRVKGFMGATPLVEFLYRAGATCSLTGEKLTEAQVSEAITTTAAVQRLEVTAFTMCPASEGFPHYVVLVEFAVRPTAAEAKAFLAAVDRELGRHNIEYHAKRDSRRLGAPELWVVEPLGYQTWRRRRIASGSNAEQIKPTPLSRDPRFPLQLEVAERVHADQLH